MIGVVVPAHDEEALLANCLEALEKARRHPGLAGEEVRIVVVLDACTDASLEVARRFDVSVVEVDARNVGFARAAGCRHALAAGARWLAFTDADSVVDPGWLAAQLSLAADVVCGTVTVDDWSEHPPSVRARHLRDYVDACGHGHIHGANLGITREAYLALGGFPPRTSDEDVALVEAANAQGLLVAWSALPRVITSARRIGRAPRGFAATLREGTLALVG